MTAKILIKSDMDNNLPYTKVRCVQYNNKLYIDLYKISNNTETTAINAIGPLVTDATNISSDLGTVYCETTVTS